MTGESVTVAHTSKGLHVQLGKHKPIGPDTIVRLTFDRSIDDIAMALPYQRSLTTGKRATASSSQPGHEPASALSPDPEIAWRPLETDAAPWLALEFDAPTSFNRVEMHLDNPTHLRGQGIPFHLEAKQADGSWQTVHSASIYGQIYSKPFPPVKAEAVRLTITANGVRHFDLYGTLPA